VFINTGASASPTTNNIHDEIKYSLRNWQPAGERRLFPVLCSELGVGGRVCPAATLRFQTRDTAFYTTLARSATSTLLKPLTATTVTLLRPRHANVFIVCTFVTPLYYK